MRPAPMARRFLQADIQRLSHSAQTQLSFRHSAKFGVIRCDGAPFGTGVKRVSE